MDCIDITVPAAGGVQPWLPLIAAVIVALATLGGVFWTVRQTRKSFREELAEKRREHQRQVIADLVVVSTRLSTVQATGSMAIPFMTKSDIYEWVDTDTSKLERELIADRDRALIAARIEVRTPELVQKIVAIQEALDDIMASGHRVTMVDFNKSSGQRFEASRQLRLLHDGLDQRINELRESAIETLAVEIDEPPRSKRTERTAARE